MVDALINDTQAREMIKIGQKLQQKHDKILLDKQIKARAGVPPKNIIKENVSVTKRWHQT